MGPSPLPPVSVSAQAPGANDLPPRGGLAVYSCPVYLEGPLGTTRLHRRKVLMHLPLPTKLSPATCIQRRVHVCSPPLSCGALRYRAWAQSWTVPPYSVPLTKAPQVPFEGYSPRHSGSWPPWCCWESPEPPAPPVSSLPSAVGPASVLHGAAASEPVGSGMQA